MACLETDPKDRKPGGNGKKRGYDGNRMFSPSGDEAGHGEIKKAKLLIRKRPGPDMVEPQG